MVNSKEYMEACVESSGIEREKLGYINGTDGDVGFCPVLGGNHLSLLRNEVSLKDSETVVFVPYGFFPVIVNGENPNCEPIINLVRRSIDTIYSLVGKNIDR